MKTRMRVQDIITKRLGRVEGVKRGMVWVRFLSDKGWPTLLPADHLVSVRRRR